LVVCALEESQKYISAIFDDDRDLEVSEKVDVKERNDIINWALAEGYKRISNGWGTHYGIIYSNT